MVLYTLYLDRYSEAKNVEVLGDSSIDEKLSADNIIYQEVVEEVEESEETVEEGFAQPEEFED